MICPDCINELVPNRKQLGTKVRWLVCPKCGYRVREKAIEYSDFYEKQRLIKDINENNLTGGKHDVMF